MKKVLSVAFCTLVLCGLLPLVNIGNVLATEPGYSVITENYAGTAITLDGQWTSTSEWADAWNEYQFPAANARFMYKMVAPDLTTYSMTWLVEFNDATNDAGDKWVICIDGNQDGGTAPQSDDVKMEITGHTTLQVYVGNGTGWSPSNALNTVPKWSNNLTTSTYIAANHWVLEIYADKAGLGSWGANPPPEGLYVGMYDASNPSQGSQGWVAWPATSADIPNRWGSIGTYGTEIPEGLSLAVAVALSSVAIVIGTIYLRKRPKTTILTPMKL
jgi:hypothetical protein